MAKESRAEVKELQERIDKLEIREKERDAREAELLRGVWILIGQLERARITPEWHPPARHPEVNQHSRDRGDLPKQEPPKPKKRKGF